MERQAGRCQSQQNCTHKDTLSHTTQNQQTYPTVTWICVGVVANFWLPVASADLPILDVFKPGTAN